MQSANKQIIPADHKYADYLNTYHFSTKGIKRVKKNTFKFGSDKVVCENNDIIVVQQVLFILDTTASMQPFINGTHDKIKEYMESLKNDASNALSFMSEYIEKIKQEQPEKAHLIGNSKFRLIFEVAVIGYRDFNDPMHFETHDFTTNISDIETFLNSLKATGGDDDPEDVKGSFIHAMSGIDYGTNSDRFNSSAPKLSWNKYEDHQIAGRHIIWLADAPAHGYSKFSDSFVDKNEKEWNDIFVDIKSMQNSSTFVKLYLMKITDKTTSTNKMLKQHADIVGVTCEEIDMTRFFNSRTNIFSAEPAYKTLSCNTARSVNISSLDNVHQQIAKKIHFI